MQEISSRANFNFHFNFGPSGLRCSGSPSCSHRAPWFWARVRLFKRLMGQLKEKSLGTRLGFWVSLLLPRQSGLIAFVPLNLPNLGQMSYLV